MIPKLGTYLFIVIRVQGEVGFLIFTDNFGGVTISVRLFLFCGQTAEQN